MSEQIVELSIDEGVAEITLNRPEAANTINVQMAKALHDAALACRADSAVRCVLLNAKGKLFCGGGDVQGFAAAGDNAPKLISEITSHLHAGLSQLARMEKPLVCAVQGPAAGAGLGLALLGDIVIASPAAHFTAAYTAVGLTPDAGLSWLLPRLVGMRRAQEMIVTNRRISAEEALAMGLITALAAADELASAVRERARLLAGSATGAIGTVRRLLLDGQERSFERHLQAESEEIARAAGSAHGREGVASFLERRSPHFS